MSQLQLWYSGKCCMTWAWARDHNICTCYIKSCSVDKDYIWSGGRKVLCSRWRTGLSGRSAGTHLKECTLWVNVCQLQVPTRPDRINTLFSCLCPHFLCPLVLQYQQCKHPKTDGRAPVMGVIVGFFTVPPSQAGPTEKKLRWQTEASRSASNYYLIYYWERRYCLDTSSPAKWWLVETSSFHPVHCVTSDRRRRPSSVISQELLIHTHTQVHLSRTCVQVSYSWGINEDG